MPVTRPAPRIAAGIIVLGALALAGCGGSDDEGNTAQAAPDASSFPAPDNRSLQQFLETEADAEGPVISPTGQVFAKGADRYGFGVFTLGNEQISDAEVAIYAAPGKDGKVQGPYPARVESLEVEPAYQSRTTSDDPDSAQVVYVADIPFDQEGEWRIGALTRDGDSLQGSLAPSSVVGKADAIPQPGDKAPVVHTDTAEDVGGNLEKIDTRLPPGTMHADDLADVAGKEPTVLLFATPALCQSRVCGPVVDVTEEVKAEYGDRAAFIHQEIYEDNSIDKGLRSQVEAFGLPTEPWLFVLDENGRVSTEIEGAFSADELRQALDKVTQ